MDLSKPTIAVKQTTGFKSSIESPNTVLKKDRLLQGIKELEAMLIEIERLKSIATSAEDWRVVMLYIATQKPRISELASFARRAYAEEFAEAYDQQFEKLLEGEKPPSLKTAEIRAKRDAGVIYEVTERFDRTWKDLESMLWVCKDIAGGLGHQEGEAAQFNAYPEHMFQSSSEVSDASDASA